MALFFFVVGLEARRELDMGELRERKRISLPVLAGVGGMAVPVLIYLAFNRSGDAATRLGHRDVDRHGVRARRAGRRRPAEPARLRVFLLTVAVVDDVIALIVIAAAYTDELAPLALLIGIGAARA